jgi:tetratricopeptide (TPR) repeat protein
MDDDDAGAVDEGGEGAATARGAGGGGGGGGGGGPGPAMKLSNRFRTFENGWVMHRLGRGFTGGRGFRVLLLLFAVPLAALAGRRRGIIVPVGMLAAVGAWLYLPPLCTVLARIAGAEWMIHRFASLQDVLFALIVPGSIAAAAVAAAGRTHVALTAFHWAFGAFCIYAGAYCAHLSAPYTWSRYLDRAFEPLASRHGRQLRPLRRYAEDLRAHVPPGAVVLAEPSLGAELVMLHDCRIVASDSSSVGVPFLRRRTADVRRMLANDTEDALRDALVERYRVTHLVVPRPARPWVYDRMSEFWVTEFGRAIVALRPAGAPREEVLGDYDRALLDAGLPREAIDWLEREIERRPQLFGLRFRLGNALLGEGRREEALAAFRAAQRLRPDDPRATIMVGNALSELGWWDEAMQAYEETIEIAERTGNDDAIASGWFNLGNMHYRIGEWAKAADAYRAALEIRPRHECAAHWLGEATQRANEEAAGAAPPPAATPPTDDS